MKRMLIGIAAVAVVAGSVAGGWQWLESQPDSGTQNSSISAKIENGRELYLQQCAVCHGANLEGQPDWRSRLASGRLPAPPHDASGHTWHHPDDVLFRITKEGTAAVVGGGYESDMPGFSGSLSDDEIWAVLTFIKSTWPDRERLYQEKVTDSQRLEGQ